MKNSVEKYGKWALVTGGSAGIGLAFAQQLAARGHNLMLVARNQSRLEAAQNEIRRLADVEVRVLALDLVDADAVQRLADATRDIDLGMVVLNAGTELSGNFTKTPMAAHQGLLRINAGVPMEMAHVFGERFVARGRGGIVFVSSLFGYQGIPLVAAYAASKAYVLTLGEALSVELRRFGVDVVVLSPGLTDTDMSAQMPINFEKMPMFKMSPQRAARVGLRALGRKVSVVPGIINKIYAFENRLLPRRTPIKMFGFLIGRAFKRDRAADYLVTPARG